MPGTFTNRIIFTCYRHMYFAYRYKSDYYLTYRYRYTFSRLCLCIELWKRRTVRRTALNNIIAETSLSVTQFDTSFETLVNTRQHTIEDIVRDALQQHGYRRVCSSIVCYSIAVNRCKFISSFTFLVSLIPLCIFLQIRSHSTKRRRRTRTWASRWTTVTHHCIFPHSIRSC